MREKVVCRLPGAVEIECFNPLLLARSLRDRDERPESHWPR